MREKLRTSTFGYVNNTLCHLYEMMAPEVKVTGLKDHYPCDSATEDERKFDPIEELSEEDTVEALWRIVDLAHGVQNQALACVRHLRDMGHPRWRDVTCPYCGVSHKNTALGDDSVCRHCRKHNSLSGAQNQCIEGCKKVATFKNGMCVECFLNKPDLERDGFHNIHLGVLLEALQKISQKPVKPATSQGLKKKLLAKKATRSYAKYRQAFQAAIQREEDELRGKTDKSG